MRRVRQQGQALVEAAVILMLVVTLFLGMFYLGKFHDIQASTIQSARYAAWERTVHSPGAMADARVQNQARARLFTWNQDALKNTDGIANGASWTHQAASWRDHSASVRLTDQSRLVARPDDVRVTTAIGPLPGKATATIAKALGMVDGALAVVSGGEALPQGGTATGDVTVKLNNMPLLPAPLNKLDLSLHEQAAVMVDNWDASGPKQAALRSRPFTLAGPISRLDSLLGPIEWALSWIEPAFDDFHMGQVCPDIVPSDRVESRAVLPAYRGGGACVR